MKSLKLSNYFELIKPQYTYLKIIPHKSVRNYNSVNIAKAIKNTYKTVNRRIYKEQKKVFFETNFKISYIVDIYSNDVSFYFLIPICFKSIIIEKIREIWSKATIEEYQNIKQHSDNTEIYQLTYKNEDALSLNINKASNEPLNSIMNILEIMKEEDRITIIYNFLPRNNFGWIKQYQDTINKIQEHKPILKEKLSTKYITISALRLLLGTLDGIFEILNDLLGNSSNKKDKQDLGLLEAVVTCLEQKDKLSPSTKKKRDLDVLDNQMVVLSDSMDKTRQDNNIISICNSYRSIDEDNELIGKRVKGKFNITDYKFNKVDINTVSIEECQNFIQLPARELLEQFKISYTKTEETTVPIELQNGVMCIGENVFKGVKTKAFLSTDTEYQNLCLCIIAPTRAGKSTFIENISKNCIDNNETVILFDFCGNCDLSNEVSSVISKNKILNIDCSDFSKMEGLGYNEISPRNNDTFEVYRCAKTKTQQLISFINSINIDNKLEPRMNRYLKASALVVFINNGSIKDVFDVLQEYNARSYFVTNCPSNQKENLSEYITTLSELDEWSKATKDSEPQVIGTRINSVQGILNRLDIIKSNAYMELMLKRNCDDNINLADEIQIPQLICLKMPETMFSTDEERDIYCTYWLTKILGSLQIRYDNIKKENRIKVNIIFDELYQIPSCQNLLKIHINRIAKKNAKPIISAHSLEQIKYIKSELKSSNTSYMLISGCNKDNYKELQEELRPEYELEDLLSLKRYYSLNLIKTNDGYSKFVTKLPNKINS